LGLIGGGQDRRLAQEHDGNAPVRWACKPSQEDAVRTASRVWIAPHRLLKMQVGLNRSGRILRESIASLEKHLRFASEKIFLNPMETSSHSATKRIHQF
jgi:hypothetical protein